MSCETCDSIPAQKSRGRTPQRVAHGRPRRLNTTSPPKFSSNSNAPLGCKVCAPYYSNKVSRRAQLNFEARDYNKKFVGKPVSFAMDQLCGAEWSAHASTASFGSAANSTDSSYELAKLPDRSQPLPANHASNIPTLVGQLTASAQDLLAQCFYADITTSMVDAEHEALQHAPHILHAIMTNLPGLRTRAAAAEPESPPPSPHTPAAEMMDSFTTACDSPTALPASPRDGSSVCNTRHPTHGLPMSETRPGLSHLDTPFLPLDNTPCVSAQQPSDVYLQFQTRPPSLSLAANREERYSSPSSEIGLSDPSYFSFPTQPVAEPQYPPSPTPFPPCNPMASVHQWRRGMVDSVLSTDQSMSLYGRTAHLCDALASYSQMFSASWMPQMQQVDLGPSALGPSALLPPVGTNLDHAGPVTGAQVQGPMPHLGPQHAPAGLAHVASADAAGDYANVLYSRGYVTSNVLSARALEQLGGMQAVREEQDDEDFEHLSQMSEQDWFGPAGVDDGDYVLV